jgi:dihydropteroate synthase
MLKDTFRAGKTSVMGILNVTPDSFSPIGKFTDVDKAVEHALKMVEEGADIIDVGGESTRPYSQSISEETEIRRVLPVIKKLVDKIKVPISIDTYKSKVAELALDHGVNIVNDISALRFDKNMVKVVTKYDVSVVLMHMKGTPKTMQQNPVYDNVVTEIKTFLHERVEFAVRNGVSKNNIIIDPGIGFGKTTEHNLQIIKSLREFKKLGLPILIGPSRKTFIGNILNLEVSERLEGTLGAVAVCVVNGADIVRVHDVQQTVRTIKIVDAIIRC